MKSVSVSLSVLNDDEMVMVIYRILKFVGRNIKVNLLVWKRAVTAWDIQFD